MASPHSSADAYPHVARLSKAASPLAQAAGIGADNKGNSSFSSVLKQAIDSVEAMGKKSDTQARAAANGKANMVDVVTAVSETEVAIDAVVAVRDKIIAAYEDIMKMPI